MLASSGVIAVCLVASQCDLNQLLIGAAQRHALHSARRRRQHRAQSPPTGFINHAVHHLSYLCGCVATHLAVVPMDRPRVFYDYPGS